METTRLPIGLHATAPLVILSEGSGSGPWWIPLVSGLGGALIGGAIAALAAWFSARAQRENANMQLQQEKLRLFNERFTTSAELIGHEEPARQLAGVHAMAGLADDWEQRRQTCINVLCAYLKMPRPDESHNTAPEVQANHEVRQAVIDIIVDHLPNPYATHWAQPEQPNQYRKDGPIARRALWRRFRQDTIRQHNTLTSEGTSQPSWHGFDFDFSGAVFDGEDFSGAHFLASSVNFSNARFRRAYFRGASFSSQVSFRDAEFEIGAVAFDGAHFDDGTVTFDGAHFDDGTVTFDSAHFNKHATVTFKGAHFDGGTVTFKGAHFDGGTVTFDSAHFDGGEVKFPEAEFNDGIVTFEEKAMFTGGRVSFSAQFKKDAEVSFRDAIFEHGSTVEFSSSCQFHGGADPWRHDGHHPGLLDFTDAKFVGGTVTFDGVMFSGSKTVARFNSAKFKQGDVSFREATFRGGSLTFYGAEFDGADVSFQGAALGLGSSLDLRNPGRWSRPPKFDEKVLKNPQYWSVHLPDSVGSSTSDESPS